MNYELFNAILSMDAYNRGYGASVTLSGNSIGDATIGIDSSELESEGLIDDDIGFYALAYFYEGSTIISYRGTDDFDGPADLLTSLDGFWVEETTP